jgi:DNA-binding NtrC family response regulator
MDANSNGSRKRHVLVVEDDLDVAAYYKEILQTQGYEVSLAPDGAEALRHVAANHTDAVICDLQMPKLEGDLFYAAVERMHPALARRFVFITGLADSERFSQFVRTVNAPVLHKPVHHLALLVEVARLMVR